MNIAYHELMNGSTLMIDPNQDVNEVCAIILAGKQNGCVILGGGSPKNFYLQGQPTLWEVYGIPKGGNDYFIQITTDQVVWGGLSGATPAEAVSWGKVNPGVLPDTVVAYCDSTIAFPLFCEYAVGSAQRTAARARSWSTSATRWSPICRAQAKAAHDDEDGRRPEIATASKSGGPQVGRRTIRASWATLSSELAPLAERAGRRSPRVYADANIPSGVVALHARRARWDVLFVLEHEDLRRARDIEHYRLARQLGRTLVTLDRDYLDDRRFPAATKAAGVIVFCAPDERRLRRLLARVDRELFRAARTRRALPLEGRKVHVARLGRDDDADLLES